MIEVDTNNDSDNSNERNADTFISKFRINSNVTWNWIFPRIKSGWNRKKKEMHLILSIRIL